MYLPLRGMIVDSGQKKIPHSRAERCLGGFRAGWATDSRAGGHIFPFRAGKDTPFPRRRLPRRIPGGLGNGFPRRRLHFSVPRRKRYPIPAQKGATKDSRRIGQLIPAQKGATEDSERIGPQIPAQAATFFRSAQKRYPIPAQKSATEYSGRIGQRNPAQAATFFRSAQKKIPHSRAEECHEGFRADWATDSRAGGNIFPFRAEKDTPFPRRGLHGETERSSKHSGSNKDKDNIKQMNI